MKVFLKKEMAVKNRFFNIAAVFSLIAVICFAFGLLTPSASFASGKVSLYENPNTGEVFLTPAPGRVKVSQDTTQKLFGIKKAVSKSIPSWTKHVKLGTTVWLGYGYYNNTGFSQDLQLEENRPGPGNNNYDAFNVNRGYINFIWSQNKSWFLRVTPNILKSSNSTLGGSDYLRLKYAYLQFNNVYDANGLSMNLKFGQTTTPLIAWEDNLLGYHFTERTPYGFTGVTSTQPGISFTGKYNSGGKTYIVYNLGLFNSGGWHDNEQVDTKSPQARIDFYPFGTDSKINGLGISGYYAWSQSNSFFNTQSDHPTVRTAALLHYKTPNSIIVLEYDYAINNLASFGNIDTSSGSICGIPSSGGVATGSYSCSITSIPFNPSQLGTSPHNTEHGLDAFGYYNFPHSKFGIFGLIQRYYYSTPGTMSFEFGNPFDFQRGVIGIGYHLNKHIILAIDEQNYQFLHAKDYRDLASSSSGYLKYGQWMGDTNGIFVQARIGF